MAQTEPGAEPAPPARQPDQPTRAQVPGKNGAELGPEDVPERPALAPNVELSGEMQEGGFADQQWLVQRNGTFIQLTELLYRVAEQANGERTLEEMAAGVSEA